MHQSQNGNPSTTPVTVRNLKPRSWPTKISVTPKAQTAARGRKNLAVRLTNLSRILIADFMFWRTYRLSDPVPVTRGSTSGLKQPGSPGVG